MAGSWTAMAITEKKDIVNKIYVNKIKDGQKEGNQKR